MRTDNIYMKYLMQETFWFFIMHFQLPITETERVLRWKEKTCIELRFIRLRSLLRSDSLYIKGLIYLTIFNLNENRRYDRSSAASPSLIPQFTRAHLKKENATRGALLYSIANKTICAPLGSIYYLFIDAPGTYISRSATALCMGVLCDNCEEYPTSCSTQKVFPTKSQLAWRFFRKFFLAWRFS